MSQPTYTSETPAMTPRQRAEAVAASRPPRKARISVPKTIEVPAPRGLPVLEHPQQPGVTVELEFVTPAIAEHYLTLVPDWQRNESEPTSTQYTDDMVDEDWWFTGDPLKFTYDNELFDGRHRCTAIRDSNEGQWMVVIRGLDPKIMRVLDTGYQRKFTHYLSTRKVPQIGPVSTVTSMVLNWRRGNYAHSSVARTPRARHLNSKMSHQKLIHTFEGMPDDIITSVRKGQELRRNFPGSAPGTVFAFAHLYLGRLDPYRRDAFFKELVERSSNDPLYPIRALEKQLQLRAGEKGIPSYTWLSWIFRTWNEWISDQNLSRDALRNIHKPRWNMLPIPVDPNSKDREEGWQPL